MSSFNRFNDNTLSINPDIDSSYKGVKITRNESYLSDNDGVGILFETEGDTLSQTLKSEHGNYSDILRKGFHHETISMSRRKDREFIELPLPRFAVVLSGTPKQEIGRAHV